VTFKQTVQSPRDDNSPKMLPGGIGPKLGGCAPSTTPGPSLKPPPGTVLYSTACD